jgi:hypothetical protein
MFKLLNLCNLSQIFENAKTKIGGMAQMVYINCLMHHFQALEATHDNATSFDIFDVELDYEKFEKHFVELHKAGLVEIREKSIHFINTWGQFINRADLVVPNPDNYVGDLAYNGIKQYEDRLKSSTELSEHCQRAHKMTKEQVSVALDDFISEQFAVVKTYNDYQSCSKHFFYWLAKKATNFTQKRTASSNNILGMK